jgi:hypothetical protein
MTGELIGPPRPEFQGPPPPPASSGAGAGAAAAGLGGFGSAGAILGIFGAVTGAIGSFYSAKSQQNNLKSQALTAEYEAGIAGLNARSSELDAQAALSAGQREAARIGLRAGQEEGAMRASIGASGTQAGVGSAAEELASAELMKQVDMLTSDVNAVRAAGAARMRGVGYLNEAAMDRTSANNLRRSARSINPYVAAGTSLLGSGGQLASTWGPRMGAGS